MTRFHVSQGGDEVVALGLSARRLALAGAGLGAALQLWRLPLPEPLRLVAAALLLALTAAIVWLHFEGLALATWGALALGLLGRRALGEIPSRGAWIGAGDE